MPRKAIKFLSLLLCFCFLFQQSGFAQVAGELDISSYITGLRNSFIQDKFRPLHLRYLSYDNLNNNFKLLLDKGDFEKTQGLSPQGTLPLEEATKTLLNYFFIGISLPNDSFWVNLRPDSPDNIIDDYLAQTDIGKILLEADLQLKKDTAQFTSPQTPEGKKYWDKLYQKAEELFGYENITIPTLTRPWIVPGEIIIRETQDNAYIYKATLKIMLEEDYLEKSEILNPKSETNSKSQIINYKQYAFKDPRLKILNEYSSQLLRELIIPKLTKEINASKRYAPLRQVYYSLILAQWFKARFYGKGGLYSWLIDRKSLNGLTSPTPWSKTFYFQEYQKSFQEGEYNIKEPVYTPFGQTIRSYMSGGIALGGQEIGPAITRGALAGGSREITEIFPKSSSSPIIAASIRGGNAEKPYSDIEIRTANPETRPSEIQKQTSSPVREKEEQAIFTREAIYELLKKEGLTEVYIRVGMFISQIQNKKKNLKGQPEALEELNRQQVDLIREFKKVFPENKFPDLVMTAVQHGIDFVTNTQLLIGLINFYSTRWENHAEEKMIEIFQRILNAGITDAKILEDAVRAYEISPLGFEEALEAKIPFGHLELMSYIFAASVKLGRLAIDKFKLGMPIQDIYKNFNEALNIINGGDFLRMKLGKDEAPAFVPARLERINNRELLAKAIAKGLIIAVGNLPKLSRQVLSLYGIDTNDPHIYLIPMRAGPNFKNIFHNRAFFHKFEEENQPRAFVFKGVGLAAQKEYSEVDGLTVPFSKNLPPYLFRGGMLSEETRAYVGGSWWLRDKFKKYMQNGDPIFERLKAEDLKESAIDMFLEPAAIFKPLLIPAGNTAREKLTPKSKEIWENGLPYNIHRNTKMLKAESVLGLLQLPNEVTARQQVLLYQCLVPERIEELALVKDATSAGRYGAANWFNQPSKSDYRWNSFFRYLGYPEGNKQANKRLLKEMTLRALALIRILWNEGYSATTRYGSMVNVQNLNPLSSFDYDTIGMDTRKARATDIEALLDNIKVTGQSLEIPKISDYSDETPESMLARDLLREMDADAYAAFMKGDVLDNYQRGSTDDSEAAVFALRLPSTELFMGEIPNAMEFSDDASRFTFKKELASKTASSPAESSSPLNSKPIIPMTTDEDRLDHSLEAIIDAASGLPKDQEVVVLDIGPGWFHEKGPVTTKKLSKVLKESGIRAKVIGIDNQFPDFIIYDVHENTAFFRNNEMFMAQLGRSYFMPGEVGFKAVVGNYTALGVRLRSEAQSSGKAQRYKDTEGNEIIFNPIQEHESENLHFVSADLFEIDKKTGIPKADIVRIANVLMPHYIKDISVALAALVPVVRDQGLVFVGYANPSVAGQEEYLVYRRKESGLVLASYMFSVQEDFPDFGNTSGVWGLLKSPANEMRNSFLDLLQNEWPQIAPPEGGLTFQEWGALINLRGGFYYEGYKDERGNIDVDKAFAEYLKTVKLYAQRIAEHIASRFSSEGAQAKTHRSTVEVKIEPPGGRGLKAELMAQIKTCYLDKGIPSEVTGNTKFAGSPVAKPGAASPIQKESPIDKNLLEQFYTELLSLSDAKDLDSARAEWELYAVEYLDKPDKCRFNHNIRWRLSFRNKKTGDITTNLGPEEVIDTLKLTTKDQIEGFKQESKILSQQISMLNRFRNFLTPDQIVKLEPLNSRPFLTKDDFSIITEIHTQILPLIEEYEQTIGLLRILDMPSMKKRYLRPGEENTLQGLRRRLSSKELILEPITEQEKQIISNVRKRLKATQVYLTDSRLRWARRGGGKSAGRLALSEEMFDVESASLANQYFARMYALRITGGMRVIDFGAGRSGFYVKLAAYGEIPNTSLVLDVDLEESSILEGENPHKVVIDENGNTILADPEEFEGIPYDANKRASTYDLIISNFVLDQLTPEQMKTLFLMAFKLLKPNGELAVGLPRTKSPTKSLLDALKNMGWVIIHNAEENVSLSDVKYKQVQQDEGDEVAEDLKHLVGRTFHTLILKKGEDTANVAPLDLEAKLFTLHSPKIEKRASQGTKEVPLDLSRINALHILAEGLNADDIRVAHGHYIDRETLQAKHNHRIDKAVFELATVVSLLPKRRQKEALQLISAWYNLERRYFPADFLNEINSLLEEFQGGISVAKLVRQLPQVEDWIRVVTITEPTNIEISNQWGRYVDKQRGEKFSIDDLVELKKRYLAARWLRGQNEEIERVIHYSSLTPEQILYLRTYYEEGTIVSITTMPNALSKSKVYEKFRLWIKSNPEFQDVVVAIREVLKQREVKKEKELKATCIRLYEEYRGNLSEISRQLGVDDETIRKKFVRWEENDPSFAEKIEEIRLKLSITFAEREKQYLELYRKHRGVYAYMAKELGITAVAVRSYVITRRDNNPAFRKVLEQIDQEIAQSVTPEQEKVLELLRQHNGRVAKVAQALNRTTHNTYQHLKKWRDTNPNFKKAWDEIQAQRPLLTPLQEDYLRLYEEGSGSQRVIAQTLGVGDSAITQNLKLWLKNNEAFAERWEEIQAKLREKEIQEQDRVLQALQRHHGSIKETALELGVHEKTLAGRIERWQNTDAEFAGRFTKVDEIIQQTLSEEQALFLRLYPTYNRVTADLAERFGLSLPQLTAKVTYWVRNNRRFRDEYNRLRGGSSASSPLAHPQEQAKVGTSSSLSIEGSEKSIKDGLCVTADTLLTLFDGRQVPIVEVKPGDYVLSLNEETQAIEPHRVNGLLDMGVKPVYKLTTSSGRSIKTTANHPYLTRKGWVKVSQLGVGDEIGVPLNNFCKVSWSNNLDFLFGDDGQGIPQEVKGLSFYQEFQDIEKSVRDKGVDSEEHNSLVGSQGESIKTLKVGIQGENNSIFLPTIRNNFFIASPLQSRVFSLNNIITGFLQEFCSFPEETMIRKQLHLTNLLDRDLFVFKNSGGIVNTGFDVFNSDVRVASLDDIFWGQSLLNQLQNHINRYAGSFDAGFAKADLRVNRDSFFQRIISHYFHLQTKLYHKFQEASSMFYSQAYAQPALESAIFWDRIISIESLGLAQVYDIEVEGTHNFIGNGIFAHNTYIQSPYASSPVTETVEDVKNPGGIDLRALPIVTQPMSGTVPLAGQVRPLAGTVPVASLDAEWRQIEKMTEAGLIPSNERIREYLQVSCQSQDCSQRIDKVLSLFADILRLEEENLSSTEPALKEMLVLLESDKPAQELQVALSSINIKPKEPVPIP